MRVYQNNCVWIHTVGFFIIEVNGLGFDHSQVSAQSLQEFLVLQGYQDILMPLLDAVISAEPWLMVTLDSCYHSARAVLLRCFVLNCLCEFPTNTYRGHPIMIC